MKKILNLTCFLTCCILVALMITSCVPVRAEGDVKTPLEWAKEEIASEDKRYEGQHVMWAVIPVEDSTLTDNEALYFIIAITEESDLVMDWYGVHLKWKVDAEKVSRDQVYIDADLIKTEVIE